MSMLLASGRIELATEFSDTLTSISPPRSPMQQRSAILHCG
jgi:hypothetical protein